MICDTGHEQIVFNTGHICPMCAMRRHIKAAYELLSAMHFKGMIRTTKEDNLAHALLRLDAAINLTGQRTPDLPRTAAEELVEHIKTCAQCAGPDDGCEEGQRLEELALRP